MGMGFVMMNERIEMGILAFFGVGVIIVSKVR
jgi:hypothetical protein